VRAGTWRAAFAAQGLRPGDGIALALSRGPELAPLHLAALAGGYAVVPINTAMTGPEVARVLAAARPRLVVSSRSFADAHAAQRHASSLRNDAEPHATAGARRPLEHGERPAPKVAAVEWWTEDAEPPALSDAAAARRALAPADVADDATALVIFTSGTTGAPKSVPLTHGNLRSNLQSLATLWQRSSDDRLLHVLPAHHFHGLVVALYGSLLAGNRVTLLPAFEPASTLAALRTCDIDLLMAVPTIYARLVQAEGSEGALASLRLAVSGSAPLPSALWHSVRERLGAALINRYGLTETGIITSTSPAHPRPGTVGAPLPGTTVALRTDIGRYLQREIGRASERGEICVRGPAVMPGYGNAPEANAAAFENGFFRSGDLGHFDERGDLWVDGRLKELIIVGGSNVVPGEVEAPLSAVAGVAEVVVSGVAHEDLGEVVGAFVVAAPGVVDAGELERRLREEAERTLAPYKRPRVYRFLSEIPRNATGKIDRGRLG